MRRLGLTLLLVPAFMVAGVTAALAGDTPPLCQTGCVTVFVPPGTGPHMPFGIARGPLGSEWFADGPANTVDRVSQRGAITAYPVPTRAVGPGWVTVDDSGNVWFAERFGGKIGQITPDGMITEFPLPGPFPLPQGIVAAPDGDLYVTEQAGNAIARLDPVTGQVTQFPVPTPAAVPLGLSLGSDGMLWFVERSAAKIGRMTLDGTITEYPLTPGSAPQRIVAGPDGALWFTELGANKVGRITITGAVTEYPVSGGPVGITVGKDGLLYVGPANPEISTRLFIGPRPAGWHLREVFRKARHQLWPGVPAGTARPRGGCRAGLALPSGDCLGGIAADGGAM